MAHTYVITSATQLNDVCHIVGTVDGFPVDISPPLAAITVLPTALALQNFLAPMMLAAAVASGKVAPALPSVAQVISLGTFSQ